MDSQQAREVLIRYRPDAVDADDPEFIEALEQAKRDSELRLWFEEHMAFQKAVRNQLKQLPVPGDLKERILSGYKPAQTIVWWRRPAVEMLAAAAGIVLLIGMIFLSWQPREDASFSAFRDRVVRRAQRGYAMEIVTTNLTEIREFLAGQQALSDFVLSKSLEKLPGDGGAVLHWHDKAVSMVCFDLGNHNDLYLFVASQSDLPGAPSAKEPQFARIGKLSTASWSSGDKTYVLAGPGNEDFLRQYLP